MQYFVRAGSLLGFSEQVRLHGQNPAELLRGVGLGPAMLNDPDLYIPYTAMAQLLENAARACSRPNFGLELGRRQGLEVLGALGPALCLQNTVGEALALMRRNLDFHARGVEFDVRTEPPWIDLTLRFEFENMQPSTQLKALSMALLARGIEQLHGRPDRPIHLGLAIPAGDNQGEYQRAFGCPVLFDQPENMLRYPLAGLAYSIRIDDMLRQQLGRQWRTSSLPSSELSLEQQVQRAISALLPTGECSLKMVAHILSLHPRSLQMKLKSSGTSFGSLMQKTRYRLACEHLARSNMSLTTLAMNLGYAEQAVFSRSFRQWTGIPPRAWRQKKLDEMDSIPVDRLDT